VRREQIVAAAIRCLGKGGLDAFKISRISKEAEISLGLINHYFDSKEELLVAAYHAMADNVLRVTRELTAGLPEAPERGLCGIVDASFSPDLFNDGTLSAWLALWGQVRNLPALRAAHNELYARYRRGIARQIQHVAQARRLDIDAGALALTLAALIDGLWLERCLDPRVFSPEGAKSTCYALLEDRLGALRTERYRSRAASKG
jgi:AcrR family transcriptional regulator